MEVVEVDRAGSKVVVKTADGASEAFKVTGETVARGGGEGIEKGLYVVVHYTGEGAEKTAMAIERVGKDAPKVIEGVIVGIGKARAQ